jgi:imidazolonepropionase-like amidohydrolase
MTRSALRANVVSLATLAGPYPKGFAVTRQALAMATSANGELMVLSGLRNPYPGKLGVVEQGALADPLVVDGNPLENIDLVADPANKFVVIVKDGVIHKNTIPR